MLNSANILAVDDRPVNLTVLTELLSASGYTVTVAASGHEAIECLQAALPDLILLDIQMPGLDGFETCQKIKANPRTTHIPIIFITASSDTDSIIKGFSVGAVDFISKSFQEPELLARVQTHLQLRHVNQLYELEQKKTEELIQLNNRLLLTQFSVDSAVDGIVWIDQDANFFYANIAACELLEYSFEELTELSVADIDTNFSLRHWKRLWQRTKKSKTVFLESQYCTNRGRTYPAEITLNYLSFAERDCIVVVFRDISDRKRVEAELQLSQARTTAAFDQAAVGFAEINIATQQFTKVNTLFCEMTGYTSAELYELTATQLTHPDDIDSSQQAIQRLYRNEIDSFTIEKRYLRKDGSWFWAETTVYVVKLQGERAVYSLGLVQDITERKAAEAKINQQNQQLGQTLAQLQTTQLILVQQEKMSALGNLVAGVAHEINNPVGFVSGNVAELKQYLVDLAAHLDLYQQQAPAATIAAHAADIDLDYLLDDIPKMLASMEAGCDRIRNISVSVRSFARADKETKVAYDLHEGLDSTLLILKHRLKANKQRPAIQVHKFYGSLPEVHCFPGQLNQVFMNLLANAIDALDESSQGKDYHALESSPNQIAIKTRFEHNQVTIHISDNGPGIPDHIKPRIFDHLYTTKEIGKGTGLGLAIVQQIIVETHGGQITVHSSPNQGTEFMLTLTASAAE